MVDPRVYRALLPLVLLVVIIFGFSLENQSSGVSATLAPGQYFTNTHATMERLARSFPDRSPGSAGDDALASYLQSKLSKIKGFTVQTSRTRVHTAAGEKEIENVVAERPGLSTGTIVVVSHRDAIGSKATADMSGTAVLLGLAHALAGQTLTRSVELISTSGQVGMAGATALAGQLGGQQVDAVIALGNLAGSKVSQPLVVPWSQGDTIAPPMLRNTVAKMVAGQTGLRVAKMGLGAQFVRLAVPFATTEQAPFDSAGIPAVLVSLSGDRVTPANTRLTSASTGRVGEMGSAILQSLQALGHAPMAAAPSSYMVISGKLVPMWAVRLLALVLILPVAATAVDSLARARRRGHSLTRWIGWVLAGVMPFLVGLVALYVAGAVGALSATPPGAVGAHTVAVDGGDIAVIVIVIALIGLSFWFLRPLCLKAVAHVADSGSRAQTPPADAAASALTAVMCLVALVVWCVNPYTAILFAPALHLWMWLAQPELRYRRIAVLIFALVPLLPAIPLIVYYLSAYGLTPWGLVWSVVLMIAGGAMPAIAAVYGAFALGCLAGVLVIAVRSFRAAGDAQDAPVTVRGPSSYAGPGSLGGTESALRR